MCGKDFQGRGRAEFCTVKCRSAHTYRKRRAAPDASSGTLEQET